MNWIQSLYFWVKEHESYVAGASGGSLIGIIKYWDHFTSETLFKIIDGCIVTLFTTAVGLIVVWVFKNITKKK